MSRTRVLGWLAAALLLSPPGLQAQQGNGTSDLAGLLPDLILRDITLAPPAGPVFSHQAHFSPFLGDDPENPAVGIVQSFNKLMMVQLSTFPLGSSTGGLTYTFDPELGTFRRASSSFGPAFAERALTVGRGRLSAGFNYQRSSYDTFEGRELGDGSIRFYLRHEECCREGGPPGPPNFGVIAEPDGTRLSPFFEGDLIEAALSLKATTDTVAFFANYGLTDRWDIGVAVPIVRVELDATVVATIQRLATEAIPLIHTFEAGNPEATQRAFQRSGTATGLGDIVVRTKYRLVERGPGALAAAADFRLPTGNERDLLGAGTQTKLFLIASSSAGRFGQHVNFGYTFSAGDLPTLGSPALLRDAARVPDEINYAAGVEVVVDPRVTVIGDVVGRTLRNGGRLTPAMKTFEFQRPGPPVFPPRSAQFEEFDPRPGNMNLVLGTTGVKVNPVGNLLLSANVLFPLTNAGLRSRITTVIGLDYAF